MLWPRVFPGLLLSISLCQGSVVQAYPGTVALNTLKTMPTLSSASSQFFNISQRVKQAVDETLLEEAYEALQIGNFRRSEQLLNQFIERYPEYAPAYIFRGGVQIKQGRFQAAVDSLNQAIELDPLNADAYNFLGLALAEQGRFSDAIDAWYTTIELNPGDIAAYNYLASVLQHQHRMEEAIDVQIRLVDKLPSDWTVHINLAELYRLTENYDEAISEIELAFELAPNDQLIEAFLYRVLGNALDDAGRFEQAEDAYLRSLSLAPNDAICHFDYGLALQRNGQLEQAAEQYRLALEIDADYFPAQERLENVEMFMRHRRSLEK